MRIGQGFDVHPFAEGRRLIIGGVDIPHERGLQGHSDADVLLHAICDALLGAIGEGDIGTHFPPSDPQWRGACAMTVASTLMIFRFFFFNFSATSRNSARLSMPRKAASLSG